ncbi:MAG: hypothetical protein JW863_19125 [Chitinispirillaceae bacterium]|nr:hypothetical protein [Chitinispirillaceae bacterium]
MTISRKIISLSVMILHLFNFTLLYAQDWGEDSFETEDESVQEESPESTQVEPAAPRVIQEPAPEYPASDPYTATAPSDSVLGEQPSSSAIQPSSSNGESGFQNAIIEGVQLTAETGTVPDEKLVTGYFIFRDKPSSYFYEVKLREKKLIFEFNDTRVGSSPVPTASEPPIKGFVIEQGKIDVNKAVKGLKPEWHDLIRVVFDLEAVPDVHVNDEYSIISFSFKWTSDPAKQKKYTIKDKTPKVILWSTAGVGGVALGAVAYLLLRPDEGEKPLGKLTTEDLPVHEGP